MKEKENNDNTYYSISFQNAHLVANHELNELLVQGRWQLADD